jgi:FkbM family methyltransferase
MSSFLGKMYRLTERYRLLYPVYMTIRAVVKFPPLLQNEGVLGALNWLQKAFNFIWKNRRLRQSPRFFEQPIEKFDSRLGFTLSRPIEYVIYNEIFLDRCYDFHRFRKQLESRRESLIVDFGVHHGLFIDYIKTLQPSAHVRGAELNPKTWKVACARFAGRPEVQLLNAGIGGFPREVTFSLASISAEQSIYSTEGSETAHAEIITPVEFARRTGIPDEPILLLKIDIEGAEVELFEHLESIEPLLKRSSSIIIEIHDQNRFPQIRDLLNSFGFDFFEQREINFFFARPDFFQAS